MGVHLMGAHLGVKRRRGQGSWSGKITTRSGEAKESRGALVNVEGGDAEWKGGSTDPVIQGRTRGLELLAQKGGG